VKLTTHLRLVQRSKNGWRCTSTPPMRLHGVVLRGSTGTPLLFTFNNNLFFPSFGTRKGFRIKRSKLSPLLSIREVGIKSQVHERLVPRIENTGIQTNFLVSSNYSPIFQSTNGKWIKII